MNVAEVIKRVQIRFGDSTSSLISPEDILDWINDAQLDFSKRAECLTALKSDFSHDTVSNADGNFALPVDFLKLVRVTYRDSPLKETNLGDLDQVMNTVTTQATPELFYIFGRDLFLWPVPAENFSGTPPQNYLKIWYVKVPETILGFNDNLEIPINFHEDIVQFCLMRAHERNENWQAVSLISGGLETRLAHDEQDSQHPYDSYPVIRDDPHDWA